VLEQIKQGFLAYHHRTSRIPYGERVVASLARHVGKVGSLLDIGCGDGVNTLTLATQAGAKRIVGVDILVRPTAVIEVHPYDGVHLPFPDRSFDAVTIVDVLHHCGDPNAVMREAIRVADKVVAVKDHFAYGPLTHKLLHMIDLVGNAKDGIPSPGNYFEPQQWVEMIEKAGGRIAALDWPLKTHDFPWKLAGWPQLQFTAKIVPVR
jgi:SAM-dependent methyltransferase